MARYGNQVQPARYISQFDPSKEQLTQSILRERSNRFEQSYANIAEEQANQGDLFFLDESTKQDVLGKFNANKEDILKKYNNDYEAAAPELASLVVKERNNPIYNLNKHQQQKMSEFNTLRNKFGNDAIVLKSVPTTLKDDSGNIRDASEFDYDVVKRSNYDKEIVDGLRGIENNIVQSGLFNSQQEGYLLQLTKKGLANLDENERNDLSEAYGEIFKKNTTFDVDPKFNNVEARDYVRSSMDRLIGSAINRDYTFDRFAEQKRRSSGKQKQDDNTLYSPRERGVHIPEKSSTISDLLDSKSTLDKVNTNKGKLDVLTNVQGVTKALGNQLSPGGIGSSLLKLRDDKEQFNAWVEAAKLSDPESVSHFVKKDSNNNYIFKSGNDAAGATKLGKVLYDMQSNDANYFDRVNTNYEKTQEKFFEEYGEMYNYLKSRGVSDDEIMSKIQSAESYFQFNNTFDLNAAVVAPKIHNKILSSLGQNTKIYEVDDDGIIDDTPIKGGRNAVSKENAGNIKTAEVDPQTGSILLTYEGSDGFKTFAIKAGTKTLDNIGDKVLTNLKDFTESLNSAKVPKRIIPVDNNTGYYIERDPETLRPIIKQIKYENNKIIGVTEEIDANFVYNDLLTQLLRSQGIVNAPQPAKF